MSGKHNIDDLFRKNAHKLDEHPGEALWERLEKRLDKPPRRIRPLRRWAMAAASLAFVGIAAFFFLGDYFSKESRLARHPQATELLASAELSDLKMAENPSYFRRMVAYQQEYVKRGILPKPDEPGGREAEGAVLRLPQ